MEMWMILTIVVVSGLVLGGIFYYQSLKEDRDLDDWSSFDD